MKRELPAVQKAYDLAQEVLTRVAKFPRDHKFTLGDRLAVQAMDVLELLVRAAYSKQKTAPLRRAHRRLDELRIFLRLAREIGPLSNNGYEHVAVMVTDLSKQLAGWRKHAEGAGGEDA